VNKRELDRVIEESDEFARQLTGRRMNAMPIHLDRAKAYLELYNQKKQYEASKNLVFATMLLVVAAVIHASVALMGAHETTAIILSTIATVLWFIISISVLVSLYLYGKVMFTFFRRVFKR